jgi:hypothetical protein
MPFLDLEALTGSDTIIYIALVIIAIQILYFAFKMISTYEKYGELTWRGVGRALKPVKVPERIYDAFVALIVITDIARAIFSREGLPLSALLFATVLVLFVAANSLERYRSKMEDHELINLRLKVTALEAQLAHYQSKG